MTGVEIAAALEGSRGARRGQERAAPVSRNQYQAYAAEEIAAVRDLAASGLSDPQISAETGISEGRVFRIRKRYGIGSRLRELSADDAAKYDNPLSPEKLAYLRQQVGWREGFDYNADDLRHDRAWRKLVSVAD